jgi:methionyl-tRNA formyltransferase
MKKIAIFGCKTTTRFMLEALAEKLEISQLITIDARSGAKNAVADYCDLRETARQLNIDFYQAESYSLKDAADVERINAMKIDLAFVIGWQRLIPEEVLKNVSIGVFGMHGSSMDLPLGRGRSPMNWSLLEDRKFFYTNLFRYDAGVDSGDILDTFLFSIRAEDTAETMHFKNTLAMKFLVEKNFRRLIENDFALRRQKDIAPTFYPKRSPQDSLIDWERDIFYIERHIRAVAPPFNGAYTYLADEKVKICRAAIFETELVDFGYIDEPAGTVVEVFPNGKFLVRCRGGLLLVHESETAAEISRRSRFSNGAEEINYFKLNQFGNYDV